MRRLNNLRPTQRAVAVTVFTLAAAIGCGTDGGDARVHTRMSTTTAASTTKALLPSATSTVTGVTGIYLNLDRVEVHLAGSDDSGNNNTAENSGWHVLANSAKAIDILAYANGTTQIGNAALAAGKYTQVRMILAAQGSTVVVNGVDEALSIPSGEQTGLKITSNIVVEADKEYVLTLDLDASDLRETDGALRLRPTAKIAAFVDVTEP